MNAYDAMTATEVAKMLAAPEPERHRRNKVFKGIQHMLGLIENQPGATWQHKWVAANADAYVRDILLRPLHPDIKNERVQVQQALRFLIAAHILRPGLPVMLTRRLAKSFIAPIEEEHAADFDAVIAGATKDLNLDEPAVNTIKYACAAMVMFTGKRLSDIYPYEWVAAEREREDMLRLSNDIKSGSRAGLSANEASRDTSNLIRLRMTYACCVAVNLINPDPEPGPGMAALPPTLDRAMRTPTTLDSILERFSNQMPPRIKALVFDVYSIEGPTDMSTLKNNIVTLNAYFGYVEAELPGHDSLDIPIEAIARILRRIRTADTKHRSPGTKRTAVAHLLSKVKTFYSHADWVVRRHQLEQHYDTLGVFPWSNNTIKQLAKIEAQHRENRLTTTVLDQVHHLDGLVRAANLMLEECDELAVVARAANPGTTFEFRGSEYRRASLVHRRVGNGPDPVSISGTGASPYRDADMWALRAAQIRTVVTVLRETGVRAEECSDLRLVDFIHMTDGDLTFPALNVNPSKQDRGRVVSVHPDVLHAVHDLVQRVLAIYGHWPHASRLDWHEGVDLAEQQLLFFSNRNRTFTGVSREMLQGWLQAAVDYYDEHVNKGAPVGKVRLHQMRRMFATDIGDRGAPPVAVQQALGHKNLQTTSIYLKADVISSIAKVTEARRRQGTFGDSSGPPDDTPPNT